MRKYSTLSIYVLCPIFLDVPGTYLPKNQTSFIDDPLLKFKVLQKRNLFYNFPYKNCSIISIFLSHIDESCKDETRVCGCNNFHNEILLLIQSPGK